MCGTSWFPGGSHLCCSKSSGVYGWSHVKKLLYRRRWVAYCSRKYDFGGPQSCLQIHSLLLAMQRELSYASSLGLSFLTWKMEMVTTSWDCGKDEMRQKGWARGRESKLTVLLRHEHYIHVKSQKAYPKTNCFCQSFRSAKILVLRAEMSGIRVFFFITIRLYLSSHIPKQSLCWILFSSNLQARDSILLSPLTVLFRLSPALSNKKLQTSTSNKV